jgi:LCP family protein required for cell wall assembly
VGDQPRRDGAGSSRDSRGTPRRTRHGQDADRAAAEPVTVEQLLARQGNSVGRRRAARRVEEPDAYRRPPHEPVAYRRPPVESSPVRQAGRPPVPGRPMPAAAVPPPPRPPVPTPQPTGWEPDSRPSRRSGPIPPLPGLTPRPATKAEKPARPGRPAREPLSPGRRRLVRAAVALAAVVGVVLLYHLGLYFYVDQKIDRVEALATDGPEVLAPAGAVNYLVVGSGVPGQDGPASVATLLASVSADGDQAVLVSFPPTALVDTPACRTPDGSLREPATEAFASSLLDGGPSCMVRAVQQLSGLRVDHYLGIDLARLPGMIDALGNVPVCVVPTAATEAAAAPLPAGRSDVSGDAATAWLQPGGTGSDVTGAAVAERAQRLLTSTLRAAMSVRTLADPLTLTRFLNRSADALTVDEQTTLGDLRVLAGSLGGLSGDAVQRAELPVAQVGYVPAGTDQAYVVIDRAATRGLFDAVIEGSGVPDELITPEQPVPAAGDAPADGGDAAPAPEQAAAPAAAEGPTVPPASITVDVLNGTGTTGLGATVADALRAQGFAVGAVGNETGTVNETVVRYGPGVAEQAKTVAAAVPNSVLQASDASGDTVQLVIGPGYSTVVPVTLAAPAAPAPAPATTPAQETAAAEPVGC